MKIDIYIINIELLEFQFKGKKIILVLVICFILLNL